MARVDWRTVKPGKRKAALEMIAETLVTLRDKEQVHYFLQRLLTESEVVMLARRIETAELLIGGLTYEQIQKKIGVGTATIQSVDRWLTDAAYEYQLVRKEKQKQAKRKNIQKKAIKHHEQPMPESLRGLIQRDSRLILLWLLVGDA